MATSQKTNPSELNDPAETWLAKTCAAHPLGETLLGELASAEEWQPKLESATAAAHESGLLVSRDSWRTAEVVSPAVSDIYARRDLASDLRTSAEHFGTSCLALGFVTVGAVGAAVAGVGVAIAVGVGAVSTAGVAVTGTASVGRHRKAARNAEQAVLDEDRSRAARDFEVARSRFIGHEIAVVELLNEMEIGAPEDRGALAACYMAGGRENPSQPMLARKDGSTRVVLPSTTSVVGRHHAPGRHRAAAAATLS